MDNLEKLVVTMEEMGMDQENIRELLTRLGDIETQESQQGISSKGTLINDLRNQIFAEPDWRRRASLAAQIVSMGFEE